MSGGLGFLRDTTVIVALSMAVIDLIVALFASPDYIQSELSSGQNDVLFAVMQAATFSGGVAASLIGFEALALVLDFTAPWPIFIPVAVGLFGVIYVCRRWLKVALGSSHRQRR